MISFPNAKLNIGLYVTDKRPDGYHNIETLFFPTKLCDVLEIIENKQSNKPYIWSDSGIKIDAKPEENLCIKALNLIKQDFEIPPVKIHLHKVIPFGAGLGGGSSDAAFTLKMLNEMFELGISNSKLAQYASILGADCAFFIYNTPHTAKGIGNELTPYSINLNGYYLMLIKPEVHISTPEAYRGISPKFPDTPLTQQLKLPISEWKNVIKNDFEDSVFPNHPKIKSIKTDMYNAGAIYASMTGSGAAVFGIFENEPDTKHANDCFVWKEQL